MRADANRVHAERNAAQVTLFQSDLTGTSQAALIVRLLTTDLRAMRTDHVAHLARLSEGAASTLMAQLEAAGLVTLGPDGRWVRAWVWA